MCINREQQPFNLPTMECHCLYFVYIPTVDNPTFADIASPSGDSLWNAVVDKTDPYFV